MKKYLYFFLIILIILSGCGSNNKNTSSLLLKEQLNKNLWNAEPLVLLYNTKEETCYAYKSKLKQYIDNGWSTKPPITLYGKNNETLKCLEEEKESYLNTGNWFTTKRAIFTYDVYQKTNLTVENLSVMLQGTPLYYHAQDFYDMEQIYGVNSLFAISVSYVESCSGVYNANDNNFFGFRGNGGWMSFTSPREGILYFGQLMNTELYYGKTMEQIGVIYCDAGWTPVVQRYMQKNWNKVFAVVR